MVKWTFTGPKGEETTVEAVFEAEARHLAMVARWGPPTGIYLRPWIKDPLQQYEGRGLTLVRAV